jgi:fucose 4-O-acetylase-like acetyltransferase
MISRILFSSCTFLLPERCRSAEQACCDGVGRMLVGPEYAASVSLSSLERQDAERPTPANGSAKPMQRGNAMSVIADNHNVPRNDWDVIFYIKGIAIFLVVLGHYWPEDSPMYWVLLHKAIYTFHMPVFFAVSGFLFFGTLDRSGCDISTVLLKKVKRLGLPYLSIALFFFAVKFATSFFIKLDHPLDLQAFIAVFIAPLDSFMPLLWFIYSLFTMMVVFSILHRNINPFLLLAASIILFIAFPYEGMLFSLNGTIRNFPYFLAGYCLCALSVEPERLLRVRGFWPFISVFFLALFYLYSINGQFVDAPQVKAMFNLLLGGSGIALVICLASFLRQAGIPRAVRTMGLYSMTIYLFHPLFESFVRHLLTRILPKNDVLFLASALTAIIAGVLFPLLLEKYVLRRYRLTRTVFLGLN